MSPPSIFAELPNHLILDIIKQGYSEGIRDYWNREIPEEHRKQTRNMISKMPRIAGWRLLTEIRHVYMGR